ncbi:MAG: recombinase family protein [Oscillospiraceae bacterium]|nr:recombinase family protein [Oscillospiraceae bacterium]
MHQNWHCIDFGVNGELMLTIMSSLAQEESRSISENVTWGQRKRMADGKVSLPYSHFLGYRKGADDVPEIVPEEAEIIRMIYRSFMLGKTPNRIAEDLTFMKIPTPSGKEVWSRSTVESILTNEKYRGSALLQKSFTVDFLTKKKKVNEGELTQFYIEESHEAIIPPEEFEMVQAEFARRKALGKAYNCKSIFTARLVCECCGGYFGSKVWHSTSKYRRVIWQCNKKFKNGDKCTTPHLYEDYIKESFVTAMNKILANRNEIIRNCMLLCNEFLLADDLQEKIDAIEEQKIKLSEKIRKLIKRHGIQPMKAEDYFRETELLTKEYENLESKQSAYQNEKEELLVKQKFIRDFIESLKSQDAFITEFSEILWLKSIDHVTICTDENLIFCFRDGTEVKI